MIGKEFERYIASEPDVFRAIDDSHASAAETRNDSVMGDGTTDHCFAGSLTYIGVTAAIRNMSTD